MDGREFNIPLDSPLDVNMNDMLVSAENPSFTFNRQKLMGGILQTSVRYEDDGYFAGWWRHQFVLISTGLNLIRDINGVTWPEPEKNILVQNKTTDRSVPYFIVKERSQGLKFSFSPIDWSSWFTGTPDEINPVYDIDNNSVKDLETGEYLFHGYTRDLSNTDLIHISGSTQRNVHFDVTINIFTAKIVSQNFSPSNTVFYVISLLDSNSIHVIIDRELTMTDDWFIFRKNNTVRINDTQLLDYRSYFHTSYWGRKPDGSIGEITQNNITGTVDPRDGSEFTIVNTDATSFDEDTINRRTEIEYYNNTPVNIIATVEYIDRWFRYRFDKVITPTTLISDATVNEPMNTHYAKLISTSTNTLSYNSSARIQHGIPIWMRFYISQYYSDFTNWAANSSGVVSRYDLVLGGFRLSVSLLGVTTDITSTSPQNFMGYHRFCLSREKANDYSQNALGDGYNYNGDPAGWVNFSNNIWTNRGIPTTGTPSGQPTIPINTPWYLQFKVRNTATTLSNNTAPIPIASDYFVITLTINIPSMTYDGTILDAWYISLDNYITDVKFDTYSDIYGDIESYNVLNKNLDLLHDKNLIFGSISLRMGVLGILIPQCVYAFAEYTVAGRSPPNDITGQSVDNFAVSVQSSTNSGISSAKIIRVDTGNSIFSRRAVIPTITSLTEGNTAESQYINVSLEPNPEIDFMLYYSLLPSKDMTLEGNIVYNQVYPKWITHNVLTSSSSEVIAFRPGTSSNITVQVGLQIQLARFIDNVSFSTDFKRSIYNEHLSNITLGIRTIIDYPPRANMQTYNVFFIMTESPNAPFDEDYPINSSTNAKYSAYQQYLAYADYFRYTYDCSLSVSTAWTFTSFSASTDPDKIHIFSNEGIVSIPSVTSQLQKIIAAVQLMDTFKLVLKPSFIYKTSGFVSGLELNVVSQEEDIVELSHGYGFLDLATNILYDSKIVSYVNTLQNDDIIQLAEEPIPIDRPLDAYQYFVNENNSADIRIIPQGIFQRLGDGIVSGPRQIEYRNDDPNQYIIKFALPNTSGVYNNVNTAYIDRETELNLLYETKDIRNNQSAKFVYQNNLKTTYQFVKQFWSNTINTENYWWIDESHVIELTRDDIIMWEKVTEKINSVDVNVIDDWNGDKWKIMTESYTELRNEILSQQLIDRINDLNDTLTLVSGELVVDTRVIVSDEVTKEKRVPRHYFFGIDDIYYNVSSAKNATRGPILFKLQAEHNYSANVGSIRVLGINTHTLLDTKNAIFNNSNLTISTREKFRDININIDMYNIGFGNMLQNNAITAYIDLNPAAVISASKISSTVLDNVFILGIAYNRGLAQWSIIYDVVNKSYKVINGYGHVGLDGSLTGGQLPTFACGLLGFSKVVHHIDAIANAKGFEVVNDADKAPTIPPSVCYGTGSLVWFIDKSISSIVSHYIYDTDSRTHKAIELPLRSMAERRYESSSFQANGLFDAVQPPLSFGTLFESIFTMSSGIKLISEILLPVLFFIDLKYVMMAYINHSFGQYTYVWRNTIKNNVPEGKTDQDIKFLQDKYTQTWEQSADKMSAWVQIILKAVEFADILPVEYKANQANNQTPTSDSIGRNLGQFAIENISDTIGDLLVSSGFNLSLKSTLSQSYTLDMFYSIDDKTQCFAGPGFVNHNLIGQCVAQSVTDTQLIGKRIGYWCTLKTLSEVVVDFKLLALQAVQNLLINMSNGVGSAITGIGGIITAIIPLGTILMAAFNLAAKILDALIIVNKEGLKVIAQLADAIGPSTGKAYNAGMVQKYNLSVEGTHTYGNKPMNFFWPAYGVVKPITYTNEWVEAQGEPRTQKLDFTGKIHTVLFNSDDGWSKGFSNAAFLSGKNNLQLQGDIKTVNIKCRGISSLQRAPDKMAVIEGVSTFLSPELFRNEQIGVAPPIFPPPPIHDYEIDAKWKLGFTASAGEVIWTTCDDTKLLDGSPSNIVVINNSNTSFCGIASSYVAIEIKDEYDDRYLRPYAVTPQAIALNINKMNCVHEQKVYHAFDGQGNRIIKWAGGSGMDKAVLYQQYQFQVNDHFKRSNILPPSQFFGIFEGPPSIAMRSLAPGEPVANLVQSLTQQQGLENDIPGENKNLQRFSIPVHSNQLSTLPAMVRMLAPYKLHVIEGITSLTTEVRTTQTRYKAPSSIDFNIYGQLYRATDEFLCTVNTEGGIVAVKDVCATAGLVYIGATTKEAFFWSPATRLYYSFSNGREIQKVDVMNRFADLKEGKWDYVNQEVMFKALDGPDVIVARLDRQVLGEVFPPNETIYSRDVVAEPNDIFYNTDYIDEYNRHIRKGSDYKLLSMAGGTVFQGPKRFIVNRFVILDYMFEDIKYYNRRKLALAAPLEEGKKNWKRVSRNYYDQYRDYGWKYKNIDTATLTPVGNLIYADTELDSDMIWWAIHGWTHNPKGLVTAMLGLDDNTDCKFEWVITFAWTAQMDKFYEKNEYATVNVQAETVTQGGTVKSDPTHIFLYKELFTKSGNAGYYTFRFQSNNGIGNRERLYIWGDAITAIQDLKLRCKDITTNRTQPLVTQVDVKDLIEI